MIGSSHPFRIGGATTPTESPAGLGVGLPILRHGSGARGSVTPGMPFSAGTNLQANPSISGLNGLTPQALSPATSPVRASGAVRDGSERARDRRRSRDRGSADSRGRVPPQPAAARAGIQTALELEEIVERLEDRLISAENILRKHAHEIAVQTEAQAIIEAKSTELRDMLDQTNDRMSNGGVTIRTHIENMRADFEHRLIQIREEMEQMGRHVERHPNLVTRLPNYPPGAQAGAATPTAWTHGCPQAAEVPVPNMSGNANGPAPAAAPAPAPAQCHIGTVHQDAASNWAARQPQQPQQPPQHPQQMPMNMPAYPPRYSPGGCGVPHNGGGGGGGDGGPGGPYGSLSAPNVGPFTPGRDWRINRKLPRNYVLYNGKWGMYSNWKDKTEDHLYATNPEWIKVLRMVEAEKERITLARVKQAGPILGVDTVELAHELCAFLGVAMEDDWVKKRTRLGGGEPYNGFEIWRRIYYSNQGGDDLIEVSGVRYLHNFPKCTNLRKLDEHVDKWLELHAKHGEGLSDSHLKTMFLGTLPTELEDEILHKEEIRTLMQAVEYVHVKTNRHRVRNVIDNLEAERRGTTTANALTEQAPVQEQDMQAMMQQAITQMMSQFKKTAKPAPGPRGRPTGKTPPGTPRGRSPSPGTAKKTKPDPRTGKCWECDGDHLRQDCPVWKKLLADNGGKPPKGHRGKYEQTQSKPHIKAAVPVTATEIDARSDATSESDVGEEVMRNMFAFPRLTSRSRPVAKRQPPKFCNSFAPLCGGCTDESCQEHDDESQMVAALESMTRNVVKASDKSSQKAKKKSRTPVKVMAPLTEARLMMSPVKPTESMPTPTSNNINTTGRSILDSLQDVIKFLESDACPSGLRADIGKAEKIIAKLQAEEGEIGTDGNGPKVMYALVDSGSGIHAIRKSSLPWIPQRKGTRTRCQTANGEIMETEGEQRVDFSTDEGSLCSITFQNCDVSMPIISVLELAKKKHRIVLEEDGGYVEHTITGQTTRIIERDGVYFLKMIINPLVPDTTFGRQGKA